MGDTKTNCGMGNDCEVGASVAPIRYTLGKKAPPALHDYSPTMTTGEADDIDISGTLAEWIASHPSAVETWLNGRPSGIQDALFVASKASPHTS